MIIAHKDYKLIIKNKKIQWIMRNIQKPFKIGVLKHYINWNGWKKGQSKGADIVE